jgi:hypothetical protein
LGNTLRLKTAPEFQNGASVSQNISLLLPWGTIDAAAFSKMCTGLHIAALRSGWVEENPTSSLLQNCLALRSIAVEINKVEAALACVREVDSLLFTAIEFQSGSYWYLPLAIHTSLLTGSVIPLTQHFASNSRESREMVLCIVSCILRERWNEPIHVASSLINLGYLSYFPGDPSGPAKELSKLFSEKMKGLLLEFCRTVTPTLAILTLSVLPLPNLSDANSQMGSSAWVELVETTLRSFFALSSEGKGLLSASTALNISIPDRQALIDQAITTKSGCCFLVLLHQWAQDFSSQWSDTEPFPPALFEKALQFTPTLYRTFEHLLVWFFLLELVESPRFHPLQCQESVSHLQKP